MPSFLSKLGRTLTGREKKSEEESSAKSTGNGSTDKLGRPSSRTFNKSPEKEKENGVQQTANDTPLNEKPSRGLSHFPSISRTKSPISANAPPSKITNGPTRSETLPPSLPLTLSAVEDTGNKAVGMLDVTFDTSVDGRTTVDKKKIQEVRLSPAETLQLTKACSAVITERGLETLGLFKPHWHSASPSEQDNLISLFLTSLSAKLSTEFSSELQYSRSPHDVADVLSWGIRHLRIEGSSFGQGPSNADDEWTWYRNFSLAERKSNHPLDAYSTLLVPLIVPSHVNLLAALFDLISSVAAHADRNAMSGSKLGKTFGWWVVSSRKVAGKTWKEFYEEWDRAARVFEHLLLAFIRDQSRDTKMPPRLLDLVRQYPFATDVGTDSHFLPTPRFTTRKFGALFIRITAERTKSGRDERSHPLQIVEEAFKSNSETDTANEYQTFWDELKKRAVEGDKLQLTAPGSIALGLVLADETLRLLSLVSTDISHTSTPLSPTLSIATSLVSYPSMAPRKRSFSLGDLKGNAKSDAPHSKSASAPSNPKLELPELGTDDWNIFSSTGFAMSADTNVATPLAKSTSDIKEKDKDSSPPSIASPPSTPGKPKRKPVPPVDTSRSYAMDMEPSKPLTASAPEVVQVDEAFIDSWSGSLLERYVTSTWPSFVVCQLKSGTEASEGKIEWLIIEKVVTTPTPPPAPVLTQEPVPIRTGSPTLSQKSGKRGVIGFRGRPSHDTTPQKKRFSFFRDRESRASTSASAPAVKAGRAAAANKAASGAGGTVNEMGEIVEAPKDEPKDVVKPAAEEITPKATPLPGLPSASVDPTSSTAEPAKDVAPKAESAAPTSELPKQVQEPIAPSVEKTESPKAEPVPVPEPTATPAPPVEDVAVAETKPEETAAPAPVEPTPEVVSSQKEEPTPTPSSKELLDESDTKVEAVEPTPPAPVEAAVTEEPVKSEVEPAPPASITEAAEEPNATHSEEPVAPVEEPTAPVEEPVATSTAEPAAPVEEPVATIAEPAAPVDEPAPIEEPITEPVNEEAVAALEQVEDPAPAPDTTTSEPSDVTKPPKATPAVDEPTTITESAQPEHNA